MCLFFLYIIEIRGVTEEINSYSDLQRKVKNTSGKIMLKINSQYILYEKKRKMFMNA